MKTFEIRGIIIAAKNKREAKNIFRSETDIRVSMGCIFNHDFDDRFSKPGIVGRVLN